MGHWKLWATVLLVVWLTASFARHLLPMAPPAEHIGGEAGLAIPETRHDFPPPTIMDRIRAFFGL